MIGNRVFKSFYSTGNKGNELRALLVAADLKQAIFL